MNSINKLAFDLWTENTTINGDENEELKMDKLSAEVSKYRRTNDKIIGSNYCDDKSNEQL